MAKRMDNGNGRPTHEEIAQRAKAIYEASGRAPGRDLENWLAAEAELMNARKPAEESRPMAGSRNAGETRPMFKDTAKDSARH